MAKKSGSEKPAKKPKSSTPKAASHRVVLGRGGKAPKGRVVMALPPKRPTKKPKAEGEGQEKPRTHQAQLSSFARLKVSDLSQKAFTREDSILLREAAHAIAKLERDHEDAKKRRGEIEKLINEQGEDGRDARKAAYRTYGPEFTELCESIKELSGLIKAKQAELNLRVLDAYQEQTLPFEKPDQDEGGMFGTGSKGPDSGGHNDADEDWTETTTNETLL